MDFSLKFLGSPFWFLNPFSEIFPSARQSYFRVTDKVPLSAQKYISLFRVFLSSVKISKIPLIGVLFFTNSELNLKLKPNLKKQAIIPVMRIIPHERAQDICVEILENRKIHNFAKIAQGQSRFGAVTTQCDLFQRFIIQ